MLSCLYPPLDGTVVAKNVSNHRSLCEEVPPDSKVTNGILLIPHLQCYSVVMIGPLLWD